MSTAISKAAAATETVQERVARVMYRLQQDFSSRIVNGHGVYADPSRQRQALSSVISESNAARDLMNATTWLAD
ncbi:hypothetical protein JHL17_16835 [Azospirillum sp. YIM B02556]|uniref:Uncharacterized protein n=1 Tax=Azospirillum endophyticum TaxID=2800326 RepID=A0ABS1F6M1_9PROT|nr:hypothetical protein [Azospirillum endophyticum]MBK1839079.1 hypothetical protein [Azospirillum endophyticum]